MKPQSGMPGPQLTRQDVDEADLEGALLPRSRGLRHGFAGVLQRQEAFDGSQQRAGAEGGQHGPAAIGFGESGADRGLVHRPAKFPRAIGGRLLDADETRTVADATDAGT